MDPIILFFGLGVVAGLLKSDLRLPEPINDLLTFMLLLTIGMKGGIELQGYSLVELLPKFLAVATLGVIIPFIAYPLLKKVGHLQRIDAASLAAHYGSVSVGTFAVVIAYLNQNNVVFEPYVSVFVVILEVPAIIIGLMLARGRSVGTPIQKVIGEIFQSKAILLLVGGLFIGALAGKERLQPFAPLFFDCFYGVLGLFLIEMGLSVSQQLSVVRKYGLFLIGFGVTMPIVSGLIAAFIGVALDLSLGGTVILATLGASSSYIAVPAAFRASLPEANLGLSMGSSLGVTFPFNVIVGIPLYYYVISSFY